MINIAICDDNSHELKHMAHMVSAYFEEQALPFSTETFVSSEELLSVLEQKNFHIYVLDIIMGAINGIALAKKIRIMNQQAIIIFATGTSDYAVDSYEVSALNYLLKPVAKEKFYEILHKAVAQHLHTDDAFTLLKSEGETCRIYHREILWAETLGHKCRLKLQGKEDFLFYSKLDDLEQILEDPRFLRVHKSYLLNMEFVLSVSKTAFHLVNDVDIPISRSYFAAAKAAYFSFIFQ